MDKKKLLKLTHELENLKKTYRHSWKSDGKRESVAEHTWRMSVMAMMFHDGLSKKVDMLKVLKMIAIHDLSELRYGDVPSFMKQKREKQKKLELKTIDDLKKEYKSKGMHEIYSLWQELEECKTPEANFVKALDKLEVRIQHNEADIDTWIDIEFPRALFTTDKYCEYDLFLKDFAESVKDEAKRKIRKESGKKLKDVLTLTKLMKKGL